MRSFIILAIFLTFEASPLAWAGQSVVSPPVPPPATQRSIGYRAATADPAQLCETAATTAEYTGHLPPRLLGAISLTETGRIRPMLQAVLARRGAREPQLSRRNSVNSSSSSAVRDLRQVYVVEGPAFHAAPHTFRSEGEGLLVAPRPGENQGRTPRTRGIMRHESG